MKLKHLSHIEWVLVFMIVAVALANAVLQLEWLRYVMWGSIAVLIVIDLFTMNCPHCGKHLRRYSEFCPNCGGRLSKEADDEDDAE
ncbi:MAG: hypothetical protein IJ411_03860 [Oscillospiraceae bacterium]|nr:hypothetical protein [Oscillospiraceae bacterium]